jgi:mono/diheme cytochrome c family protein
MLFISLAAAPVRTLFRFDAPSALDLAGVMAASLLAVVGFDVVKQFALGRSAPRAAPALFLLLAVTVILCGNGPSIAAESTSGQVLYGRYCAACHGIAGRGDGPAASALRPLPTDLTRLDSTSGELMRQIDGRRTVRAHGSAEMPVWGVVFEQSRIGEPHRRRTALLQVQAIADYVRSLRERSND